MFRQRIGRLIGQSRQARVLTISTATAVLIAVGAFIVLNPASEKAVAPEDPITKALDVSCVQHKKRIAAAQDHALVGGGLNAVGRYADSLVAIVGEWRMELDELAPPADRAEAVDELKSGLLEVEIEAGSLARVARESNRRAVAVTAARVDAATEHVEAAVGALGLERCGRLAFKQGRSTGQ